MDILKQFRFVILLAFILLILVLLRSSGAGNFKPGAERLAAPSAVRTNLIRADQMESLPGNKMIVLLSDKRPAPENTRIKSVAIPEASITNKKNISLIRKNHGPVILYSGEAAASARVWMILSQLGMKDIYILTSPDSEVFKYKFRPDSLIRPEL